MPWRVGGETGFTVDAASFPDSAGWLLEVYLRIRPATLEALADSRYRRNRFRLAVRLRNAFGSTEHDIEQELDHHQIDDDGAHQRCSQPDVR